MMRTSAAVLSMCGPDDADSADGTWPSSHSVLPSLQGVQCTLRSLTNQIPAHQHDGCLITFILRGSAEHEDEHGRLPLLAGDVCIIPPGQWHAYPRVDGTLSLCSVELTSVYLTACLPLLGGLPGLALLPAHDTAPLAGVLDGSGAAHLRLSPAELSRLRPLLLALTQEVDAAPTAGQAGVCAGLLLQILGLLGRYGSCPHARHDQAVGDDAGILAALQYLEEHWAESLTIEDLARHTGYTPTYLARKFRQHLALSPSAYLLRLRLQHACALLQTTNQPISSIARDVGFRDSQHFAKRFRQAIATTPSAFRARTRTGMEPKGTEIDKPTLGAG